MPTYADYLSPAIRYSELLTNVTRVKIYDAVYCTHALCSMSFSPRALTNVAKLMTPAFPLLFVQHLERIIRIIKFNRHRDIGIVHALSYLSSGFLFLGFHRTRCLLGQWKKAGSAARSFELEQLLSYFRLSFIRLEFVETLNYYTRVLDQSLFIF